MTAAGTPDESGSGRGSIEAIDDEDALEADSTTQMRRLHPLTPFLRSWRLVGGLSAVAISLFREDLNRLVWIWHALHGDFEVSLLARAAAITVGVAIVIVFGGWLSWRATGFAILADPTGSGTLLFHRGVLAKQRNQVRLLRVQSVDINRPLVPRLLGLAAVRLDMAAGQDASVNLAYLRLDEASALREEILRRMTRGPSGAGRSRDTGGPVEVADARGSTGGDGMQGQVHARGSGSAPAVGGVGGLNWSAGAVGSQRSGGSLAGPVPPDDVSRAWGRDELIAEVSTEQVVKSNLLDGMSAWVVLVVWIVVLVVATVLMGWQAFVAALSGFIPVTIAILAQLRRQVVSMMRDADFKLFRTPTGVRISSGMTSTVNRTIHFDRIQGVRLVEPFWWRRFGWARVKLDIAGGEDDFNTGASLIPVADRADALALIAAVTGVEVDSPRYTGVGEGARLLDPVGWRFQAVALVEDGALSRSGRWRRSTAFVPYARVQSVSARQGLLQRKLRIATVFLDLPKGSMRWVAKHRASTDAASLVAVLAAQARRHRLAGGAEDGRGFRNG
jgi:putative membrane protein